MNSGTLALRPVCRVKIIDTDLFNCPVYKQINRINAQSETPSILEYAQKLLMLVSMPFYLMMQSHTYIVCLFTICFIVADVDVEALHVSTGVRNITSPQS